MGHTSAPGPSGEVAAVASAARSGRRAWPRWLPPARLTWVGLAVLALYEVDYLAGLGWTAILALPMISVLTDLSFQAVRYRRVRFPDAALVTGLFLALIFAPTAPLLLTGAATIGAIAARHLVRTGGHPWFNPAALGVVAGAVLFGLAPAW
ncbi:MAG: RnfABCDGE type electron transport complex subunit D, partial [Thermoplasmata archaeon]